jgi:hypothetical protein
LPLGRVDQSQGVRILTGELVEQLAINSCGTIDEALRALFG